MKLLWSLLSVAVVLTVAGGCRSVHSVDRADPEIVAQESSIVFTRPDRYSIFGTRSLRDFVEIVYERLSENESGQKVLEVGIRFRGATSWYNAGMKMPESMSLAAQSDFYAGKSRGGAPVYSTNRRTLTIRRGATEHYRVVCPVDRAGSYQVTLSETGKLKE